MLGVDIAQAQTQNDNFSEVRQYLNSMFQQLNKNLVPTGYLLDYGIDLVDMEDYEGMVIADSTAVNMGIYRDILRTISSSNVHTQNLYNSIKTKLDNFERQSNGNNVLLSASLFEYNAIKENALSDNLIVYDEVNNKVRDVYNNGVWVNPYDTKYLFAFVANTEVCNSPTINYTLPSDLFLTNTLFSLVSFDAGDGAGYANYTPGSTVSVTYNSTGFKTLKLRLKNKLGRFLEANTIIYVNAEIKTSILSEDVFSVREFTSSEFNGETVSATIVYRNNPTKEFRKPFIVVEGFDPWQLLPLFGKSAASDVCEYSGYTEYQDYKDWLTVLENTYDYNVVYVEWKNSEADIRANAYLLQQIIREINTMKSGSSNAEKNVVFGLSMGGLVARYALRDMELKGELHDVATYVSGDTPHLGVNVPVGYQAFINQFLSFVHGYDHVVDIWSNEYDKKLSDDEKVIKQYITSDSARQMMYCYVEGNQIIDSAHNEWQQIINSMGYPQGDKNCKIELIALANESTYNYLNSVGDNCLISLDGYAKASAFLDIALTLYSCLIGFDAEYAQIEKLTRTLGSNKVEIEAEVNLFRSTQYDQTLSKLKVVYKKRFLWLKLFEKTTILFSSDIRVPSSTLYYEDVPGSLYTLNGGADQQLIEKADQVFADYNYTLFYKTSILFVPTASALNLYECQNEVSTSSYQKDFVNNLFEPTVETPFDSYHVDASVDNNDKSENHIKFSSYAKQWLINQVNMKIDGPDFIALNNEDSDIEAQYSVSGVDDNNASFDWYVSDNSIASIDRATGKLTANSTGIVEITAVSYRGTNYYRKTKKVYVGFPDFVILKEYIPGLGYKFEARLATDTSIDLGSIREMSDINYEWYIIDNNGDCSPVDDGLIVDDSFSILPSKDEVITVVLRLSDNNGNYSQMKSVTVNLMTPFVTNYQYVAIDNQGRVHFVKNDVGHHSINFPESDFAITFRDLPLDDNDIPALLGSTYLKGGDCYLNCRNVESEMGICIVGNKVEGMKRWTFNFFDLDMFVSVLEDALNNGFDRRRVIAEYELIIMNSMYEVMQRVPFKIIYNPTLGI